ncbi:MAG: hypothetical protein ACRDHZ_07645 [Ktedonobacteraceae bacterium]
MENSTWVSLRKALEISGMKPGTFTYYVRTGRVQKREGRGKRDHQYNEQDILQLQKERKPRNYTRGEKQQETLLIDWIKTSDVPSGLKLAQALYHEEVDLADAVRYQAWRKYNPYISMGAFSPDREVCYAALMLVPLEEHVILDILSGKREESSIESTEIQRYDQHGGYALLAASALCIPDRPSLLYRVMSHFMDFFVEQYPEKYVVRIYAQAVSDSGDMLVQHLFMAPRPDLAPNAYELNLARPSASRIIRRFQARLATKDNG